MSLAKKMDVISEKKIVWVDGARREDYPYLREEVYKSDKRASAIRRDGLVAYATLQPDAPNIRPWCFARRVWYFLKRDRELCADVQYAGCPQQGVKPSTIAAGRLATHGSDRESGSAGPGCV